MNTVVNTVMIPLVFLFCFSMRETSRLVVIPLTEEVAPSLNSRIDERMRDAAGLIGKLVALNTEITSKSTQNQVEHLAKELQQILPVEDASKRLSNNYGMVLAFTEVVSHMLFLLVSCPLSS